MTDLPLSDPGPEAVDKMLNDMEAKSWHPTDVARFARRLRAHIVALRERVTELEGDLLMVDVSDDDFETLVGGRDDRAHGGTSG